MNSKPFQHSQVLSLSNRQISDYYDFYIIMGSQASVPLSTSGNEPLRKRKESKMDQKVASIVKPASIQKHETKPKPMNEEIPRSQREDISCKGLDILQSSKRVHDANELTNETPSELQEENTALKTQLKDLQNTLSKSNKLIELQKNELSVMTRRLIAMRLQELKMEMF